jgi:hypothetical protein
VNLLAEALLERVDWESLRAMTSSGTGAEVPEAVARLAAATTTKEARSAFASLDNNVVVQGNLFEAGPPLIPILLALLTDEISPIAFSWVMDLLVELGLGESHESEVEVGRADLDLLCHQYLREGLFLFYHLLLHADEKVRHSALVLLDAVELDRERLKDVARAIAARDSSQSIHEEADRILQV